MTEVEKKPTEDNKKPEPNEFINVDENKATIEALESSINELKTQLSSANDKINKLVADNKRLSLQIDVGSNEDFNINEYFSKFSRYHKGG